MLKVATTEQSLTVTNRARTSGLSTLTIASTNAAAGDTIVISGVPDSSFNGTFSVASATGTTISYYNAGSDVTSTASSGTIVHTKWTPTSPLVQDTYSRTFASVSANYISATSGPTSQSLVQSTNAGQLNLSWAAPTTYGTPSDGETYSNTYTYRARNISTGFYSGNTTSPYYFTGLANATAYTCEAQARNAYRTSTWTGGGGLTQYTRTVRQYGSISVNASGSASYGGNNAPRAGGDSGYMYHGYYSSNQGLQKAGFYYDFSAVPANAVVTGATLALNSLHWYNGSGGTIDVRVWGNTWTGSGTDGGTSIATQAWGARTGAIQFNINTATIQAYIRGKTRLVLGVHAPSNSTAIGYYGYFYGASQYGCPLNISYYWDS